ncbi:MAG: PDZ domain-containing protein [Chthoniobacter sp.]|nr:PDZ domain-containing protein [Chthoniobacter sp.]
MKNPLLIVSVASAALFITPPLALASFKAAAPVLSAAEAETPSSVTLISSEEGTNSSGAENLIAAVTSPDAQPAVETAPAPGRRPNEQLRAAAPMRALVFLGVSTSPIAPGTAAQLGLPEGFGLVVESVVPESPAARAGVQPRDVLRAFNDQQLAAPTQLAALVRATGRDADASLTVLRGGQEQKLRVRMAERPAQMRMPQPSPQSPVERPNARPPESAPGNPPRPQERVRNFQAPMPQPRAQENGNSNDQARGRGMWGNPNQSARPFAPGSGDFRNRMAARAPWGNRGWGNPMPAPNTRPNPALRNQPPQFGAPSNPGQPQHGFTARAPQHGPWGQRNFSSQMRQHGPWGQHHFSGHMHRHAHRGHHGFGDHRWGHAWRQHRDSGQQMHQRTPWGQRDFSSRAPQQNPNFGGRMPQPGAESNGGFNTPPPNNGPWSNPPFGGPMPGPGMWPRPDLRNRMPDRGRWPQQPPQQRAPRGEWGQPPQPRP